MVYENSRFVFFCVCGGGGGGGGGGREGSVGYYETRG